MASFMAIYFYSQISAKLSLTIGHWQISLISFKLKKAATVVATIKIKLQDITIS